MKTHIYQIYYSDESRLALDSGFTPLDNTGKRPDWREYWPIREFLLGNDLDPDALYGFLSPSFARKTKLRAPEVIKFAESAADDVDVVTFSPFYDMAAFFLNVFEHAAIMHPGIAPAIRASLGVLAPGLDPRKLVTTSEDAVFCNYLVAKPAFWREWMRMCEQLFDIAESGIGETARLLNADVRYGQGTAPAKVFIIERVATLIMSTQPKWRVQSFNSLRLPTTGHPLNQFGSDLLTLDGLKFAARKTGIGEYLMVFRHHQAALGRRVGLHQSIEAAL